MTKFNGMVKQVSILVLVGASLVGCTTTPTRPLPADTYKTWAAQNYGLENCTFTGRLSMELAAHGKTVFAERVGRARKSYIVDPTIYEKEYAAEKQLGRRYPDSWCLETTLAITQAKQEAEARERKSDSAASSPTVIVQPATKTCNTVLGWTHCM